MLRVLWLCCIHVLNSSVGIPLETGLVHGPRFLAMDMAIQALGQEMFPATVALSEPTNGSLYPEKSIHPQRLLQPLVPVVMGAVLSQ